MDFRRCNLLVVRPQETNISVHYAASRSSAERQWALLDVQEQDPYGVVGAVQSRVLLAQYALCSNKGTLVDAGLVHLLKAESVGHLFPFPFIF